jgi:hypothetical protein
VDLEIAFSVCNYSISPASKDFTSSGGTGSIAVVAPSGCSWTASESVDWITITSGSSGSGNGTVSYTVTANTGTSSRTATITVAGKSHTVNQEPPPGTAPTITITSPTSNPTYTAGSSPLSIGGTASVGVTQVTWVNDRGGSGTCTGTTSWSASGIALLSGTNIITVTARDAAARTGIDTLSVTFINTPPTISNANVSLLGLNDPSCSLSLPYGSLFLVTFNGNGPINISQAHLYIAYDFPGCCDGNIPNYVWNSSLSGDGFSGTATTRQCYRFGSNTYVDVTMTIEDLLGATSNALTVTINKPAGSN